MLLCWGVEHTLLPGRRKSSKKKECCRMLNSESLLSILYHCIALYSVSLQTCLKISSVFCIIAYYCTICIIVYFCILYPCISLHCIVFCLIADLSDPCTCADWHGCIMKSSLSGEDGIQVNNSIITNLLFIAILIINSMCFCLDSQPLFFPALQVLWVQLQPVPENHGKRVSYFSQVI